MKSTITIFAVTLACLSQGAANGQSQQITPGGYRYLPMQQAMAAAAMPAQYAPPVGAGVPQGGPIATPQPVPAMSPGSMPADGSYSVMPPGAAPAPMPYAPTPAGPVYSGDPGMTYSQPAPAYLPTPTMASEGCSSGDCYGYGGDCGVGDCSSCGGGCGGGFLSGLLGGALADNGPPRPARVWGGVEYLLWWNKNRTVPVLATTSVTGTPFNQAGVLGASGTSVLFGGGGYDDDPTSGVRGSLGYWLDQRQTVGLWARGFQLGQEDINFAAESSGTPILARPFDNIDLNIRDSLVVAYPGLSRGRIDVQTKNTIRGFDLLLRKMLYYGNCNRLDFVGGYQTTRIDDSVRVGHWLISEDPQGRVPVGTRISSQDVFDAKNEFHGGVIGLLAQGYDGRFTWNLLSKVAFGNTQETLTISGSSTTTIPNAGSATSGQGLLALNSNQGVYQQDEFTIVPELDLSLAYQLSSQLQLSIGYSALFWTNAVMAGQAIDTVINPTQIDGALIGASRPTYSIHDTEFWAQGLTFGVQGRF